MKSLIQPEVTAIRRVRMRGKSADPLHDQLMLSGIINSAGVSARGLPRSAILCIRSLKDPMPGKLLLDRSRRTSSAEWEKATIAAIEELAEKATRPILHSGQSNAESVLFADGAELLACLAVDWLEGNLTSRWWWRGVLHNDDVSRAAVSSWLDAPEYVPAALHHLAWRQQAITFTHALQDDDARRLLQKLTHTYGLHELHSVFTEDVSHDRREGAAAVKIVAIDEDRSDPAVQSKSSAAEPLSGAPWQQWVPESDAHGLDVDRHCLLGIGLSLHRAPAVARSQSFAREVMAWYRAVLSHDAGVSGAELPISGTKVAATQDQTGHVMSEVDTAQQAQSTLDSPAPPRRRALVRQSVHSASSAILRVAQPPASDVAPEPELGTIPSARATRDTRSDESRELLSATDADRSRQDASRVSLRNDVQSPAILEAQIETKLGGLFYLINLALHLNLYADFTRPLEPGISLPIWDYIALIGRRLLAGRFPDDPVWGLLAHLAGRAEDEIPGRHFEPPEEWRMPAEWLGPFASHSEWNWSADKKRLRVRHPEGFCMLDVRTRRDVRQHLQEEIQVYVGRADFDLHRGKRQPTDNAAPLERWLNWLLPFLSVRLRRALGLDREDDLPGVLFNHRGRIEARAAHLDVHLALADLPISIRHAGLDRDPGWVPAAGRFVAFHFQ